MSEDHDPMQRVISIIMWSSVVVLGLLILWAWEAGR